MRRWDRSNQDDDLPDYIARPGRSRQQQPPPPPQRQQQSRRYQEEEEEEQQHQQPRSRGFQHQPYQPRQQHQQLPPSKSTGNLQRRRDDEYEYEDQQQQQQQPPKRVALPGRQQIPQKLPPHLQQQQQQQQRLDREDNFEEPTTVVRRKKAFDFSKALPKGELVLSGKDEPHYDAGTVTPRMATGKPTPIPPVAASYRLPPPPPQRQVQEEEDEEEEEDMRHQTGPSILGQLEDNPFLRKRSGTGAALATDEELDTNDALNRPMGGDTAVSDVTEWKDVFGITKDELITLSRKVAAANFNAIPSVVEPVMHTMTTLRNERNLSSRGTAIHLYKSGVKAIWVLPGGSYFFGIESQYLAHVRCDTLQEAFNMIQDDNHPVPPERLEERKRRIRERVAKLPKKN